MLQAQGAGVFAVQPAQSARTHSDSLDLALHLQQQAGVETIATLTTWDKTIMTLQAELLGAHALGIRNVICTTGSPPVLGDYPAVDGIWEVDSLGLIALLAGLNEGRDSNGLATATQTSFCIGARVNPGARDPEAEIARARAKVRAGAHFLVSRPVYELDSLLRMVTALEGTRGAAAAVGHPAAQLRGGRLPGQRGPRGDHPAGHAAGHGAGRPRRGPRGRHRPGRLPAARGPQAGQRRDRHRRRRRPGRASRPLPSQRRTRPSCARCSGTKRPGRNSG